MGVSPDSVTRIYSQLEPCGEMPGGYCADFLANNFPGADVSFTYPYPAVPEGAALRQASVQAMRQAGGG